MYMFFVLFFFNENALKQLKRPRHCRDPEKQNSYLTSRVWTAFFYYSPPKHTPAFSAWTINSPSVFWARVQQTGGDGSREGEWKRQRMCRAHKWGSADSCGLRRCVKLGLQKRGQNAAIPLPQIPTWTACLHACMHRRPDRLKTLQGINNSQQHCEGFRQRKQRAGTQWSRDWRKPERLCRPRPISARTGRLIRASICILTDWRRSLIYSMFVFGSFEGNRVVYHGKVHLCTTEHLLCFNVK